MDLNFIRKVLESFQAYCQAAVHGEQQFSTISHKGAVASVHVMNVMNVMELATNEFIKECPNYTGAHLILTVMPKVHTCMYVYVHM